MSRSRWLLLRALALLSLTACLGLAGCKRPESTSATREDKLVVFAAASLRDVFIALADAFEGSHPGVALSFHFAGTQQLRSQLEHGAAADVFASADQRHMAELVRSSRVSAPVVFARNEPVLVVATEAQEFLRDLSDLPRANRIVIGAAEVPIGHYTLQILDRAASTWGADFRTRVEAQVVSRELNVRQVLAKVSLGEAQAGLVYRTDVGAHSGRVSMVTIPADLNVIAEYPIAIVAGTTRPVLARAWIDFVLSAAGQRTLREAGFLPPSQGDSAP